MQNRSQGRNLVQADGAEHRYKGVKKIIPVFLPLLYDAYTMMERQEGANVGRHGGDICEMKGDSWRIMQDVSQSRRVMGGGDPQRGRGMEPRRREIYKGVTHVPSLLSLPFLLRCAFVPESPFFLSALCLTCTLNHNVGYTLLVRSGLDSSF